MSAVDPSIGDTSVCRTCNCPITFKTVNRGDRYLPITTWSDGWRVDEHVCFKAVGYQHEPPRGRCRRCRCTEEARCEEGCTWVHPDLCSSCHQCSRPDCCAPNLPPTTEGARP